MTSPTQYAARSNRCRRWTAFWSSVALALSLAAAPAAAGEVVIESSGEVSLQPRGVAWDLEALGVLLRTEGGGGSIIHIPASGQTTFFHLRFRVDGPAATGRVSLRARLDGESFCSTNADVATGINLVARCTDGWVATAGLHEIAWEADLIEAVDTDPDNDDARRLWNTGGSLDVAVERVFFRSAPGGGVEVDSPTAGTQVFFHLGRTDAGLAGGGSFGVRAELDGSGFCSGSVSALGGAGNAWCSDGWTATAGPHTVTWTVDPDDELAEIDENNNTISFGWTAQVVSSPTAGVDTPTPELTATVPTPPPATATEAAEPTPTPLSDEIDPTYGPRRAPAIIGDCDGDRRVAINELISGVRIALDTASLATCAVFDADLDFAVSISELVRAVNFALFGGIGEEFLPDVFLRVVPGALLLEPGRDTGVLRLEAYSSAGQAVAVASLDIEWLSSDPGAIRVEANAGDPARATVTVLDELCNAIVVARLRDHPSIVSPPVNVMRAKLHPEAEIVADEEVVFPPPGLPDGVDLSDFPVADYEPAANPGDGGSFGGFSEAEIAAFLEAGEDFALRYPIVLRGAAPAIGQRLVAGGGSPIAGVVVDRVQRGDFCLLQLELVPPSELFEDLEFSFSAEELQAAGLLSPLDTSEWEDDSDFESAATTSTTTPFEFEVGKFVCKPPLPSSVRPTLTQSPAPSNSYFGPIWDGNLRISGFSVERFFYKVGLQARAFLRPEIRLTPGVQAAFTCDIHRDYRVKKVWWLNGAFALILAPYIDGFLPSFAFDLNLSGGPTARFGVNIGFDYAFWTGATYTAAGGWEALCENWSACSRTNQIAETVFDFDTGPQISVEGEVGGYAVSEAGILGLGGFLSILDKLPLGSLLDGARAEIEKRAQLRLLRARIGPELSLRWHNGRRTAFIESSESAANLIVFADLKLTFDSFAQYLRNLLGAVDVLSIPLLRFDLFHFAEPYRILNEETLAVNGERYSLGDPPIEVGQGQTVSVVSTVTRDFINLSLIDLFLTRLSPHQEFPHTGEMLIDGDVVGTLAPSNDFRLAGSFDSTRALCERAEQAGGSLEVKLLAYNRMFSLIPTANYVGSFLFTCTDNRAPVVDAGSDREIDENQSVSLNGMVDDDGLPIPPGVTVATWTGIGPGAVDFADRRRLRTTATFSAPGTYILTLTADDGELSASDSLRVTVRALGDRTPPDFSVESCGGTFSNGQRLSFAVEASDESGVRELVATLPPGIADAERLSRGCPLSGPCTSTFNFRLADPVPVDIFFVELEAEDRAGNRATRSCRYEKPGASQFSFRKIVDSETPAPGADRNFGSVSRAAVGGGNVVFRTVTNGISLWADLGSGPQLVVDDDTQLPDPFAGFGDCTFGGAYEGLSLQGDTLAFAIGGTCLSSFSHIMVVDLPTYLPGSSTGIAGFTIRGFGVDGSETPELADGEVIHDLVFVGDQMGLTIELLSFDEVDDEVKALYVIDSMQPPNPPGFGPAIRVADYFSPRPGGSGMVERISGTAYDDGVFAFRGLRVRGNDLDEGVYTAFGAGSLQLVADEATLIPDGEGTFTSFCGVSIDGTDIAFVARGDGQQGVYLYRGGQLTVVANRETLIPGRTTQFLGFGCETAFDQGRLVFTGSDTAVRAGLFLYENGELVKILNHGDMVDDLTLLRAQLYGDKSLDGTDLVFSFAADPASPYRALYLADLSR